ncbi:DUF4962 domain-containing protein [Parapedobacter soli]|uniref:DUF4962 domain-containing protein n=1 Tax=Parapedobacter soli TaxID=416955 RepID=UPI0021C80DD5|nr:DUF4962 domain-containing protein [Parapedobacter soli]
MVRKQPTCFVLGIAAAVVMQCSTPHTTPPPYPGTVYSRYLAVAQPTAGIAAQFNVPVLRWPAEKEKTTYYDVRLSQDSLFRGHTIYREQIPWAMFNPHQRLSDGQWYWQYRVSGKTWSALQTFQITPEAIPLVSPPIDRFFKGIPPDHPRLLADGAADIPRIRTLVANGDAEAIIREAEKALKQPIMTEREGLPKNRLNDAEQNRKLEQDASKRLGDFAYGTTMPLCQAYLLTGDSRYRLHAIRIAREVATWDTQGVSKISDFSDARCMLALATVYDTFHTSLDSADRVALVGPIVERATGFYISWRNDVEAKILSGHVWQHILHYFFQTGIAVYGKVPEAAQWLAYAYELFLARAPILGGVDGGWIEGASYFRMNMATLIDIPLTIKQYTGFDFISTHPWYTNTIDWLLYHVPPGSSADGFGDNTEEVFSPGVAYIAYADILARLTRDPRAAEYVKRCRQYENPDISADKSLRWIRLSRTEETDTADLATENDMEMGKVFREIGLAALHSNPANTDENLMVAMRSSPFGSYGHFLSDQNSFNILYGGKRAFFRTGYKVTMKDPHRTGWYQHTKSNNSVLIDGAGQPYSVEAYGWIPRFLQGEDMAYVMGDASAAYSSNETNEDHGVKKFYRHLLLLKPDIIVVYDELESDHPASWSWLLHSMARIHIDTTSNRFSSHFDGFNGVGKLWTPDAVSWSLADTFEVRAENWRGSRNESGELKRYDDEQWHLKAINRSKTRTTRFLAVFQIGPAAAIESAEEVYRDGVVTVSLGDWDIQAQLDTALSPNVSVMNHSGTTVFSTHAKQISLAGKNFGQHEGHAKLAEKLNSHIRYVEAPDELPHAIRQRLLVDGKNDRK